ncbi:MAG: FKBP-type peptidyl-prolyl cis-trans isomerase [Chitinophagaceae bacterium]|jgi:FKBP-type peptidyl-prolyl cis-trans isomerase FklB|nr:FKBP-type peptidyl-prolyl cis-trans isomerase [Chitinophagaceae bacterium]
MKQLFFGLMIGCTFFAHAQTKPKPAQHRVLVASKSEEKLIFKNEVDSFSYAIGASMAEFYKQQGLTELHAAYVSKGIEDAMSNKQFQLSDKVMDSVLLALRAKLTDKQNAEIEASIAPNKAAGAAFLAANKNKPGIVALPSGLQYQILKEGTGPKPTATDRVKVNYRGTTIDGVEFDNSYSRGEPIVIPLNNVIHGWTEALQLMPVGSKWKLFIPSSLAYGDREMPPIIKAGSTLIFEVELLDIVK